MGLLYGVGCQAYAGGADVRAVKTLWEGIRDVPSLSRGEGQKGYVAWLVAVGPGGRHRGPGPQGLEGAAGQTGKRLPGAPTEFVLSMPAPTGK